MRLEILPGERLHPRSRDTVKRYNERVGFEVLTWHQFRLGINPGILTKSGQRLRIPTRRYGRRLYVSMEGIDRWAQALAEADFGQDERIPASQSERPLPRSATRDNAARIAVAERFLEAEGL